MKIEQNTVEIKHHLITVECPECSKIDYEFYFIDEGCIWCGYEVIPTKPLSPEAFYCRGLYNGSSYPYIEQQLWLSQYYFTRGFGQTTGENNSPKKPIKTLKKTLNIAIKIEKRLRLNNNKGWGFNCECRKDAWEKVKLNFERLNKAENYNQYVERIKKGKQSK